MLCGLLPYSNANKSYVCVCVCMYMYVCVYIHMKVKVKSLSRVRLFATPWTVVYQAPPSMGFSRQE